MNRANYNELTKLSDGRYRLSSKHSDTYLTTCMVLYTDPMDFGLHEADVMEAISKRHQSEVGAVCGRLAEYTKASRPVDVFNEITERPLIDWADQISNPEEFMAMVADVRLLDELIHDRVNYEVKIDTAHLMD